MLTFPNLASLFIESILSITYLYQNFIILMFNSLKVLNNKLFIALEGALLVGRIALSSALKHSAQGTT